MNIELLKEVCNRGNKYGSAFKEILKYYNISNNDLSLITNEMAREWLERDTNNNQ